MPFGDDGARDRRVQVDVRPSAVLDLTWVLNLLQWGSELPDIEPLRAAAPDLQEEIRACLADGGECLPDTSILAERVGALLTDEADTFLGNVERAARLDGAGLELRSESPQVRAVTLERLERLRREPGLAARYAAVLGRIWKLVGPAWEETGRDVVLRACADWSQRLRQGAPLSELLSGKHILHRADLEPLLTARPRIVLSPMYFAAWGGSVVDMTTYVHVGGPARPGDPAALRRKESDHVAARLKVLADGTRVALLRELACEPASVMELARKFQLAQPTVSNHVRMLREAGLLESRKDGSRIVYRVARDKLGGLLDTTRELLLDQ